MRHPAGKSSPKASYPELTESGDRVVPTFIATDLLEKLIADRDAYAVDRVVSAARRH
jgi:hypothetical protein